MYRPILACLLGLALSAASGRLAAEPIWAKFLGGRRVEADPAADYRLTDQYGPWLIMAATFSGPGANDQARELVLELRRRYKMEAYVHEVSFDFSKGTRRNQTNRVGERVPLHYRHGGKLREIAVLVGNFESVEDREAQRTLQKIKLLRPRTLNPEYRPETSQSLAALRMIQVAMLPEGHEDKKKGHMRKAFVTRNPLIPRDYFVSKGPDKLVLKMNKGVKNSLLDCKGQYTVQVATFKGTVILDQNKIRAYQHGTKMPSRLAEAADKAHRLTKALRKKGYDAYEFHDRYASVVTIGSFESVGLPRADGKIEINPKIHSIMKTFGARPVSATPNSSPGAFQPKSFAGIPFDLQPTIVHVPKRSLSNAYRR